MNAQIGDMVHVRARVTRMRDGNRIAVLDVDGGRVECHLSSITHVEPRKLKVGDMVTWGGGASAWKLHTIIDGVMGVVADKENYLLLHLSDLRAA